VLGRVENKKTGKGGNTGPAGISDLKHNQDGKKYVLKAVREQKSNMSKGESDR